MPTDNPISTNFSKYENIAKQKFLESISSNNNIKKKSTITNINFNTSSNNITNSINPNINNNNNDLYKANENLISNEKNEDFSQNKNQAENKNSLLEKESNFSYKKLNQVHSEEETPQWEKAWNWIKIKFVEVKNNENVRTCVNPFRNDPDPYARYCYYCMTATCCFIWFLIFYMAMSTS